MTATLSHAVSTCLDKGLTFVCVPSHLCIIGREDDLKCPCTQTLPLNATDTLSRFSRTRWDRGN